MPGENIYDWLTTAADNGNADTLINWAEGQPRASVNNSARSMMAAHAKQRNLLNGSIVTTGSANAQAFVSGIGFTAPAPTGLRALLKIGTSLTNTGAATLNMDSIGDVPIKNQYGNNLSAGDLTAGNYREFLFDGTNWILLQGGTIRTVSVQTFINSGTYTPTVGMIFCIIECVGGGGGGGGAVGGGAGTVTTFNGGGGGGGGYSRTVATAAAVGVSQVVTVGAFGAGGLPGIGNGSAGGISSVGSLCSANGGSGGLAGYSAQLGHGGDGALAGTGSIVAMPGIPGNGGLFAATPGTNIQLPSGNGGASHFGGGGRGVQNGSGTTGGAYGAGGSGGGSFNIDAAPGSVGGGAGGSGIVVITEFGT